MVASPNHPEGNVCVYSGLRRPAGDKRHRWASRCILRSANGPILVPYRTLRSAHQTIVVPKDRTTEGERVLTQSSCSGDRMPPTRAVQRLLTADAPTTTTSTLRVNIHPPTHILPYGVGPQTPSGRACSLAGWQGGQ